MGDENASADDGNVINAIGDSIATEVVVIEATPPAVPDHVKAKSGFDESWDLSTCSISNTPDDGYGDSCETVIDNPTYCNDPWTMNNSSTGFDVRKCCTCVYAK